MLSLSHTPVVQNEWWWLGVGSDCTAFQYFNNFMEALTGTLVSAVSRCAPMKVARVGACVQSALVSEHSLPGSSIEPSITPAVYQLVCRLQPHTVTIVLAGARVHIYVCVGSGQAEGATSS